MREKEHEEYNALTKRLLEEGYTVDNHPDYVRVDVPMWQEKTLDNYDGGGLPMNAGGSLNRLSGRPVACSAKDSSVTAT